MQTDECVVIDEADDDGDADAAAAAPTRPAVVVSDALTSAFHDHVAALQERRKRRKSQLTLRGVAESVDLEATTSAGATPSAVDATGGAIQQVLSDEKDVFEGDGVLRTLRALLARIDEKGYARSRQQLQFHDAFIRACSRVLYRSDWANNRPNIMKANQWDKCPSEILISTPRYAQPFSASAVPCSALIRRSLLFAQALR